MSRKGFRCFECDAPARHAHHVVPLARGGTRTIPLCYECHELVHGLSFDEHSKLTRDGIERARLAGKPIGRPALPVCTKKLFSLRERGLTYQKIADEVGLSSRTIMRRLSGKR